MVNNKFCYFISLVFLLQLFISCNTNTFDDEEALLEYLKDEGNGYVQKKSVNGIDFELMYRPTDLLVKQELGDSISSDRVKALREKYSKYLYFNLSMSKNNKELLSETPKDRIEFGVLVNQLAFDMNKKIHLYTKSKDTIRMLDFVYPRMYGMSKTTTIMFVYPREKEKLKESNLNFIVEDLNLYTGEVKFKIQTKVIKSEPHLVFKNLN